MRLVEHAPVKRESRFLHTLVPIAESIVPIDRTGRRREGMKTCGPEPLLF